MATNPTKVTFLENDQQLRDLVADFENAAVDAENFASATGSFTDADGNTFQKGAKGWAADAEGYKNTAQTEASVAETAANNASQDAATAEGAAETVETRVSEETRSHGVPLSEESLLRFFLDRYADGQNGDASYSGESAQYALPGLPDLEAYLKNNSPGAYVGVVGGQTYKQQIKINEDDALVTGLARPGQTLPFIDCLDELENGDWSLASNQSNTYVQSEPTPSPLPNANFPRVFEDGDELKQRGSIADVDSNAASYYVDKSSDPWEIYVHPSGSTNPVSDGKLYQWTARAGAVRNIVFSGSVVPNTIRGLMARAPLANNGAITISPGGTIERCYVEDGGKHHFLHGGGLIRDSVLAGQSPNFGTFTSIGVVYYHAAGTPEPQPAKVENLIGVDFNNQLLSTSAHSGFEGTVIRGATLVSPQTHGIIAYVNDNSDVRGLFASRSRALSTKDGTDITVGESMMDGLGASLPNPNIEGSATVEHTVSVFNRLKRRTKSNPQGMVIENSLLIGGTLFRDIDDAGGTIEFYRCILAGLTGGLVDSDFDVTGRNNIIISGREDTETHLRSRKSLSQLQTDTGAFTNTVFCTVSQWRNLLRGDWRKGNATLNPDAKVTKADGTILTGEMPSGGPITDIGPQKVWDYHRKEAVSGAPSQWPTPPTTKEEGKEYVEAPGSWPWKDTPVDHKQSVQLRDELEAFWEMDGSAGTGEPDQIKSNDMNQSGTVEAGSTSDFPYRDFSPGGVLRVPYADLTPGLQGPSGSEGPSRFWFAFPLRVPDASGSSSIWSFLRKDLQFLETASGSLKMGLTPRPLGALTTTVTVDNSFNVVQMWYDPESGQCGLRIGGAESTFDSAYAKNLYDGGDDLKISAGTAFDVGPCLAATVVPSKADRDWLQNGGAFRSLSEIKNRSVTVKDI